MTLNLSIHYTFRRENYNTEQEVYFDGGKRRIDTNA